MQSRFVRYIATFPAQLALVFAAAAATDKPAEDPEVLLRQIRSRTAVHLSQLRITRVMRWSSER